MQGFSLPFASAFASVHDAERGFAVIAADDADELDHVRDLIRLGADAEVAPQSLRVVAQQGASAWPFSS
jgi:hypothetical protein